MDSFIFAAAFHLLACSITIVFLMLNMFLDKAFKMQFSKTMLMMLSSAGTYAIFIFAQTMYFSNAVNVIAPDETWYPAHIGRAISIPLFSLFACFAIVFLTQFSKTLWKWIVGTITVASVIMFFAAPYLMS